MERSEAQRYADQIMGRIRAAREDRGWSARELAARAGVDHTSLSRNERGGGYPTLVVLIQVTDVLDLRVDGTPRNTPLDAAPEGR